MALTFFSLCFSYLLFKGCSEILLLRLTQTAVLRLRTSISNKVLASSYTTLQRIGKHGLMTILTNDIESFIEAFHLLPLVFGNAIIIVTCLGYIGWLSLSTFTVTAVLIAAGTLSFHFAERYPLAQLVRVRTLTDSLNRRFRDLIEGSRELQLNATRGRMFVDNILTAEGLELRAAYTRSMTGYMCVTNIGSSLFYIVIGMLLFVLPLWIPQSTKLLVLLTFILLYLIRPISEMMSALPSLRRAAIALTRVQSLDASLAKPDSNKVIHKAFGEGRLSSLELRDVQFQHQRIDSVDRSFRLGPLNLSVGRGEIVFVVGGNGSGKTTFAMLLLGFLTPDSGSIFLNGIQVSDDNRSEYRDYFAAVLADFHLFEDLLISDEKNLSLRAQVYIEALNMKDAVTVTEGKFSTINLSTGQRKRLALISAYLEDKPFYLFDEWAADQDPVYKRLFYTEFLPELKSRGKTILVITHDDAYFSFADRVIVLENGMYRSIPQPTTVLSTLGV